MSSRRLEAEASLAQVDLQSLHIRLARIEVVLGHLLRQQVTVAPGGTGSKITYWAANVPDDVFIAAEEIMAIARILQGE